VGIKKRMLSVTAAEGGSSNRSGISRALIGKMSASKIRRARNKQEYDSCQAEDPEGIGKRTCRKSTGRVA